MVNGNKSVNYKLEADRIAASREGCCLSEVVPAKKCKIIWKCHVLEHRPWQATLSEVAGSEKRKGTWCRDCGMATVVEKRRQKAKPLDYYKAEADALAEKNGGRCLSDNVPTTESNITWKCSNPEHPSWQTTLAHVRGRGKSKPSWCRKCRGENRRLPESKVRERLLSQSVQLRSKYGGSENLVDLECLNCGHLWQDRPEFIFSRGHVCTKCERTSRKLRRRPSIESVKRELAAHGFELLSTEYTDRRTKLHLRHRQCGHDDWMALRDILPGRGCRQCSSFFRERFCKYALEKLLGVSFKKIRPSSLRGLGGLPLEFDLFNADLKLAVEHNGAHHYRSVSYGGKDNAQAKQRFKITQEHDRRKREYCLSSGITLIEIRELGEFTPLSDLKNLIKRQCLKGGVPLPPDYDCIELDLSHPSFLSSREEMWIRIVEKAKRMEYTLKTTEHTFYHRQIELLCPKGHDWKTSVANFLHSKNACHVCYQERTEVPVVVYPINPALDVATEQRIRVFRSASEAAKTLRVSSGHIDGILSGRLLSAKGHCVSRITRGQMMEFTTAPESLVRFCEEQGAKNKVFEIHERKKFLCCKPVICSDGRIFKSASESARALGVDKAKISHAVLRNRVLCGLRMKYVIHDVFEVLSRDLDAAKSYAKSMFGEMNPPRST